MATIDTPMPQAWPRWVARRPDRRRFAVGAVAVLSSLAGVDVAVHAVAVPQAAQRFEMNTPTATAAAGLGSLLTVALLLGAGLLGDRLRRRPILLAGGIGMGIGCLATTFAADEWMFLVGRAVTGMAAAAVVVTALSVLPGLFFASELPAVVGMWLAVQSAAVLAGGVFGGLLVTETGWRTGYLLTAVLAMAAVGAGWLVVPATRPARARRFDLVGALLAGAAPAVLFVGIGRATEIGWRSSQVLGATALAGGLALLFAWWEYRRPNPAVPMRLMRSTPFAAACLAGVACEVAAAVYLLPIAALLATPAEPARNALVLAVPMYLGMVLGAVLSGTAWQQRVSVRALFASGLVCCAGGALLGSAINLRDESWLYATAGTVVGFGVMWTRAPQTAVIVAAVAPEQAGVGAAVHTAAVRIGSVLGPALLVPIVFVLGGGEAAFFRGFPVALRVTALLLAGAAVVVAVLMYKHRARTTAETVAYCRYRAGQRRDAGKRSATVRFVPAPGRYGDVTKPA
ncbi:MFS transporter [Nocardia blacklockiae]|uniref:MFS transporter n=1 Tax=Nocardia blacklockiae TaxID=480036 RepID=UPI00189598C3|nr:MFS transporter [Nocardia blacklockiae]MBF6173838.1 MFS transporter [Nocardia blacklockiae]